MKWLWLLLLAPLALVALYGAHRALCRMEERGWIYYRKGGSGGSVSRAAGELQALLEPGHRHAVEERRAERGEPKERGGPPRDPAARPTSDD